MHAEVPKGTLILRQHQVSKSIQAVLGHLFVVRYLVGEEGGGGGGEEEGDDVQSIDVRRAVTLREVASPEVR